MNCIQCNFRTAAKGSRYCLSNTCCGDRRECPVQGCPGFAQWKEGQHISIFCEQHQLTSGASSTTMTRARPKTRSPQPRE